MAIAHSEEQTERWFAAQVRVGREHLCAQHLRARGYHVFLPCYREQRRWFDRIRRVERALFAGYLFCQIDAAVVAAIVTTPGVLRIVGDGRGPLSVPTQEIEDIRRVVEAGLAVEPWQFVEGQQVTIDVGPLRGVSGVVLRTTSRHRLVVAITLLQRSVAVEIEPEWASASHDIAGRSAAHAPRDAGRSGPPCNDRWMRRVPSAG